MVTLEQHTKLFFSFEPKDSLLCEVAAAVVTGEHPVHFDNLAGRVAAGANKILLAEESSSPYLHKKHPIYIADAIRERYPELARELVLAIQADAKAFTRYPQHQRDSSKYDSPNNAAYRVSIWSPEEKIESYHRKIYCFEYAHWFSLAANAAALEEYTLSKGVESITTKMVEIRSVMGKEKTERLVWVLMKRALQRKPTYNLYYDLLALAPFCDQRAAAAHISTTFAGKAYSLVLLGLEDITPAQMTTGLRASAQSLPGAMSFLRRSPTTQELEGIRTGIVGILKTLPWEYMAPLVTNEASALRAMLLKESSDISELRACFEKTPTRATLRSFKLETREVDTTEQEIKVWMLKYRALALEIRNVLERIVPDPICRQALLVMELRKPKQGPHDHELLSQWEREYPKLTTAFIPLAREFSSIVKNDHYRGHVLTCA